MGTEARAGIDVNDRRITELLQVLVRAFAHHSTQLAVWSAHDLDLSCLPSDMIVNEPPAHSGSFLPGNIVVLQVDRDTIEDAMAAGITRAAHLELSSNGTMRFAAYDRFTSVCVGEGVSNGMLEALKTEGLIVDYRLH